MGREPYVYAPEPPGRRGVKRSECAKQPCGSPHSRDSDPDPAGPGAPPSREGPTPPSPQEADQPAAGLARLPFRLFQVPHIAGRQRDIHTDVRHVHRTYVPSYKLAWVSTAYGQRPRVGTPGRAPAGESTPGTARRHPKGCAHAARLGLVGKLPRIHRGRDAARQGFRRHGPTCRARRAGRGACPRVH